MSAGTSLPGTPEPEHRWRIDDGLTIAGDAWGDPRDPLVVLMHGAGQTRHAWKNAGVALAAAGYQSVAYDARGHGDSDWSPTGSYNPADHAADLVGVLTALGRRRPALVGASMGGGTGMVAVGAGLVDASALVLIDTAHRIEPAGADHISGFMSRRPDGFDTLDDVADAIANYRPHTPRRGHSAGLAKNVRRGDDGRLHWHWDPQILRPIDDPERHRVVAEQYARDLTVPAMLVRGGLSDVVSATVAAEFLELVPHAEYRTISGAGHMIAGDRNDAFVHAIIDFLHRALPSDRGTADTNRSRHPEMGRTLR